MGAHGPQALPEHLLLHRLLFMGCKPCQEPAPAGALCVLQLPSWHVHCSGTDSSTGCSVDVCSGVILHGLQGNTCSTMDHKGNIIPAPGVPHSLLLILPWRSHSGSSHIFFPALSHSLLPCVFFLKKFLQRHHHYGCGAQLCPGWVCQRQLDQPALTWSISSLLSQRPLLQSPHCQHLDT